MEARLCKRGAPDIGHTFFEGTASAFGPCMFPIPSPSEVAMLFDFNGVIADDEPVHFQAFQRVLATRDLSMSADVYRRYLGLDDRGTLAKFLHDSGEHAIAEADLRRLVVAKQAVYEQLVARGNGRARLFPAARALVQALYRFGVPLAVVSGARRAEIESSLTAGGLGGCFRVIVAAEDVVACKPDPAGYATAFGRLRARDSGVRVGLAIEDAPAGIVAARAAGLLTIGVTTSCAPFELVGADRVVDSLGEIDAANPLRGIALRSAVMPPTEAPALNRENT